MLALYVGDFLSRKFRIVLTRPIIIISVVPRIHSPSYPITYSPPFPRTLVPTGQRGVRPGYPHHPLRPKKHLQNGVGDQSEVLDR